MPEEEDRQRLRDQGFGVLRVRDRYEFDETGICRENYFELSNAEMRLAGKVMALWGYGLTRPMNTLPNQGFELSEQLAGRWQATLEDDCEEAIVQMLQQGGRECSGALWNNSGTCMRLFWRDLKFEELPFCGPMKTVLFNDVLALLNGEQPGEERAKWWLNQGIPGVLIRFQKDGMAFWRERGVEIPGLRKQEGVEEALARRMLYDRGEMGRMFRDLIEQDLTKNFLELGIEQLLGRTTPSLNCRARSEYNAALGDWLLEPWWAMAQEICGEESTSHMVCARWRNMQRDAAGQPHPMFEFELTDDDRELIRHWVLQHRARLLTGRWEYSPAWSFYVVVIQIFWLHGLETGETSWFGDEHNGWELVLTYELITEHIPDVESRWVPNDSTPPQINELDWRFREVILPEVERMAQEFCDSVGVATTMASDPRWAKEFYPWNYSPTKEEEENGFGLGMEARYAASLLTKESILPIIAEIVKGYGWKAGSASERKAKKFLSDMKKEFPGESVDSWCAAQGWNELVKLNKLIDFAETQ